MKQLNLSIAIYMMLPVALNLLSLIPLPAQCVEILVYDKDVMVMGRVAGPVR